MNEQQKQNLAAILRQAKEISAKDKKEAVRTSDFDRSFRIASNEAKVEEYFQELIHPAPHGERRQAQRDEEDH